MDKLLEEMYKTVETTIETPFIYKVIKLTNSRNLRIYIGISKSNDIRELLKTMGYRLNYSDEHFDKFEFMLFTVDKAEAERLAVSLSKEHKSVNKKYQYTEEELKQQLKDKKNLYYRERRRIDSEIQAKNDSYQKKLLDKLEEMGQRLNDDIELIKYEYELQVQQLRDGMIQKCKELIYSAVEVLDKEIDKQDVYARIKDGDVRQSLVKAAPIVETEVALEVAPVIEVTPVMIKHPDGVVINITNEPFVESFPGDVYGITKEILAAIDNKDCVIQLKFGDKVNYGVTRADTEQGLRDYVKSVRNARGIPKEVRTHLTVMTQHETRTRANLVVKQLVKEGGDNVLNKRKMIWVAPEVAQVIEPFMEPEVAPVMEQEVAPVVKHPDGVVINITNEPFVESYPGDIYGITDKLIQVINKKDCVIKLVFGDKVNYGVTKADNLHSLKDYIYSIRKARSIPIDLRTHITIMTQHENRTRAYSIVKQLIKEGGDNVLNKRKSEPLDI